MDKDQILGIKIPDNEKVRHYLSLKYLDGVYSETKEFDQIGAKIASRFPVNSLIKAKMDKRESYLESWQKLCTRLFYYLLGPAKFFDRKDADSLVCLPICCKITVGDRYDLPTWAINVYNNEKRIVTIFHKDPEFDNEFSFYTDKLVAKGSWVGEVRTAVQQFNLYGLNIDLNSVGGKATDPNETFKAFSNQESAVYGNTITVYDIFKKIESIKQKL